jgi:hypothetical protein
VVIEGYKRLKLADPAIDALLTSPNTKLLGNFRHEVVHYQPKYFGERFMTFIGARGKSYQVG